MPLSLQSPAHHNISRSVREIYPTKSRGFLEFATAKFATVKLTRHEINPPSPCVPLVPLGQRVGIVGVEARGEGTGRALFPEFGNNGTVLHCRINGPCDGRRSECRVLWCCAFWAMPSAGPTTARVRLCDAAGPTLPQSHRGMHNPPSITEGLWHALARCVHWRGAV